MSGEDWQDPIVEPLLVVTSPTGPRAHVADPPFTDVAPLLAIELEVVPGESSGERIPFLHLDLAEFPQARQLLLGQRRPGTILMDRLGMLAHATGNGYVGIEVVESTIGAAFAEPAAGDADVSARAVRVAIDPATHASGLALMLRTGGFCLAYSWRTDTGEQRRALLPRRIRPEVLGPIIRAALINPRGVPVTAIVH